MVKRKGGKGADMTHRIKDEHRREIIWLYFEEMKNYSYIIDYYKGRYTYAEIRKVIKDYIKKD